VPEADEGAVVSPGLDGEIGGVAGFGLSAGEPGAAFPLVSSDIFNAVPLGTAWLAGKVT